MGKDVIVACDFSFEKDVYDFLDLFESDCKSESDSKFESACKKIVHCKKPFVKIGMELFYSAGPAIIKNIKNRGHKIFLDLKCHDIPTTVKKTMKVIASFGVDICNVHAAGGVDMMKAALQGLAEGSEHSQNKLQTKLIAVTQLTSTDQKMLQEDLLIAKPLEEVVLHYAMNAKRSLLHGVVASPMEVKKIHEICGSDFITVTPGIRLASNLKDDQKRVTTPCEAKEMGSDYIVVGRPITEAKNPLEVYEQIVREFVG
ncbi:MAG: orotidine-5'-phosphate decarboxylase [Treponema sp.]|nr:orotidine-5'-phosphate decarboxylase [Treponema sp.]